MARANNVSKWGDPTTRAQVSRKLPLRHGCFHCATIAYHVELNADLGRLQAWPTSKNNRHLVLA